MNHSFIQSDLLTPNSTFDWHLLLTTHILLQYIAIHTTQDNDLEVNRTAFKMSCGIGITSKKHEVAHLMMRVRPMDWLRHGPIDVRDEQLINANPVSFVAHGSMSFVRKLVCMS